VRSARDRRHFEADLVVPRSCSPPVPRIDPSGYDAGKKIKGKKRHIAVDTLGLMVGFFVWPGDIQDRNAITPLLKVARTIFPSLARAIADGGYQDARTR
jgi:hypothetical protein